MTETKNETQPEAQTLTRWEAQMAATLVWNRAVEVQKTLETTDYEGSYPRWADKIRQDDVRYLADLIALGKKLDCI